MADISNFNLGNGESVNFKDAAARTALDSKADKVSSATNGNFAGLDSNGNLTDSGKKASDFLPSNTPIPSITNCYQTTDTEETALANADYVPFYDISASAKRKTSWSNIKSVLKTYFDTLYSKVVANPSGTATGTLTKLGIGSDIYDIQGGGGGSDKADISAIGTNETGATASKAYALGEHFYKNGKFCTAKAAIAQGATFTLGTNYVEGTISDSVNCIYGFNEYLSGYQKLQLRIFSRTLTSDSSGFIILPATIAPYLFIRAIPESDTYFLAVRTTTDRSQVVLRVMDGSNAPVKAVTSVIVRVLYFVEVS